MATRNTGAHEGRPGATPGTDPNRGSTTPMLKDQAADLGRRATEGARQMATEAQSQAQARIERGKHDAATTLTTVASTLLNSGSRLRDEDQPMAGEYIERAARQIERAANYIESADLREVVHEVEDFARRRPAVFIGTAFAAGLLAARFLKSSRATVEESGTNTPSYLDREVPSPVAQEPGPGPSPASVTGTTPWQAPSL